MTETYLEMRQRISSPALIAEKDQYRIQFAKTEAEVLNVQRLRYEVFNLEQGKGLDSANASGIDQDEFDSWCIHLMVMQKESQKPVGTYRINLGPITNSDIGFYSEREYSVTGLEAIRNQTLEVGRSCVSSPYRNGTVVALLWEGISALLARTNMRYLIGCVSLEDTAPVAAWAVYGYLQEHQKIHDSIFAVPRRGFELPPSDSKAVSAFRQDFASFKSAMPPLLKGYLRLGAKICGPPAFDYEFGTTDFLIVVDVKTMSERYSKHFNVPQPREQE